MEPGSEALVAQVVVRLVARGDSGYTSVEQTAVLLWLVLKSLELMQKRYHVVSPRIAEVVVERVMEGIEGNPNWQT